MLDPLEGLAPDGTIVTGVRRDRVPPDFEPVLADLVAAAPDTAALFLYGSLATGQARIGRSDVDVIAFGLDANTARSLSQQLSETHRDLTRGVAIGVWSGRDLGINDTGAALLDRVGDAAYGNRVFARHYCVLLSGPDPLPEQPAMPGDQRAARGFNGDFPDRLMSWQQRLADFPADADPAAFARGLARKTLFATAGLVSVHDHTWTTDRATATRRWGELHPHLRADLNLLLALGDDTVSVDRARLIRLLDTGVRQLAEQFRAEIGVWDNRT